MTQPGPPIMTGAAVAPQSAEIGGGVVGAGAGIGGKLPVAGAGGDAGLLGNIAAAFAPLSGLDVAAIPIAQFLSAADAVVPLYDVLFGTGAGGGFVGNRLKQDVTSHIHEIRELAARNPGTTYLVELIEVEIKNLGDPAHKALRSGPSATHGMLWLLRTLKFIDVFMAHLATDTTKSPTDLARDAYTQVLRPFHGMMIAGIVRAVMGFVPSRDKLRTLFGFSDDDAARRQLANTEVAMRPSIDRLMAWVQSRGLDFPDKASG